MNVDFAFQLGLALSICMLIAHTDDRYSGHSIQAGTYAAATFTASFLVLEFVAWEWCQCLKMPYLLIPALYLVPFLCLVVLTNVRQRATTGNMATPFYQLCYDLGGASEIAGRMHLALIGFSALFLASLGTWGFLRRKREEERPTMLETALQVLVVVFGLAELGTVLYSFAAYRNTITNVLGANNPETIWTLGQIMAISAWIPIVICFVYLLSPRGEFTHSISECPSVILIIKTGIRWLGNGGC